MDYWQFFRFRPDALTITEPHVRIQKYTLTTVRLTLKSNAHFHFELKINPDKKRGFKTLEYVHRGNEAGASA